MTNTTFHGVTPAHVGALQAIAKRLGYLAERGPTKGEGSASALIRTIADGELTVSGSEWISVEDALPPVSERVIVSNGEVSTAAHCTRVDKTWRDEEYRLLAWEPTHWRRFGLSPK